MRKRARGGSARRPLGRRRRGEVAVFDIVLFVPLLVVALLFLDSTVSLPTSTVAENVNSSRYAEEAFSSAMEATVPWAQTWFWIPPTGPFGPCPFGCWSDLGGLPDMSVQYWLQYDIYLVSCGVTTQAQLDTYPFQGYFINLTVAEVAMGALPPAPRSTYSSYYFEFNGSATGGAGVGCLNGPHAPPVRAYDSNAPSYPGFSETEVYAWSSTLAPTNYGFGYGGVDRIQVQLGLWGP